MRSVLFAIVLSGFVAGSATAKRPAPTTSHALARTLPVVDAIAAELVDQATPDLRHYRRALLARLLLDQGRVAMSGPQALHDAMVLAAVCTVLAERQDTGTADEALVLAQSTYTLHAAGHAYRTRPSLRAAVSELERAARRSPSRALFKRLARSAGALERVGRRWFPEALHEALRHGAHTRELNLLRGLWLEREGRLEQAAQAVGRAVAEKATVAVTIDLVRLLARAGDGKAARTLADRLRHKAPGASGVLDAVLRRATDMEASEVFQRRREPAGPGERLLQAQRYARLDRFADAEGLLSELVEAHLTEPQVFDVAAGLYLRWRRLGRLARLIDAAESLETPPSRLVEVRVAAVVAARLAGTRGTTAHALSSRKVREDLDVLGEARDPALRRFAAHAAIILAATARKDAALEKASARALRVELSATTLEVIAAAWLSVGRMDRAITELERGIPRLAPSRRAPLTLSLASLELAVGAGREDRALLRKGLGRLPSLEITDPSLAAERVYLQAVGGRVAAWLGSAAPGVGGPGASDEAALRGLLPLVDRIDPTRPRGAVVVAGATLSAGALGLAAGSYDLAIGAFQIARRLELSPFMEALVVGQVALAADDPLGAGLALDGAVSAARTQVERFLAHKWRALASNRSKAMAEAQVHFTEMLGVWKAAGAPHRKVGRQPVALLLGGVEIAASVPPSGPARIEAVLTATPALAADFPHDRRRIETLVKGLKKPKATRRKKGKR